MSPSRQRQWQLRQQDDACCGRCGASVAHYASLCDACALKARREKRKRLGNKPWRRGARGRPPRIPEVDEDGAQ